MNDEFYMKHALKLARRGESYVSPNPMVGAVIVKNGKIIGEGYHRFFGQSHAEVNAIASAKEPIGGADFYITLEPCCHQGKTPPCVDAILKESPRRVVIGTSDPNPLVSCRGIQKLQKKGIETTVGILDGDCRRLNERFFKFMETGLPFVTLKFAQTLDGRLATATGNSRWISSPASLRLAHQLRASHDAIMAGIGTILHDDPELTVRLVRGRQPIRIILDPGLRIPDGAKVLKDQEKAKTIIFTSSRAKKSKVKALSVAGIEIIFAEENATGGLDLVRIIRTLGGKGISSLLVEGGSAVITSFIRKKLADRITMVVAPKLIGRGIESIGDLGIRTMDQAILPESWQLLRRGNDLIIDWRTGFPPP